MEKKSDIKHSKFWLGDHFDLDQEFSSNDTIGLIKLAALRRAIANFVFILTGKNIPVRFCEKHSLSLTDGKIVYINGALSRGEFDSTVGLALHEAAHIIHSDFTLLKNMWQKVPKSIYDLAGKKLSKSAIADFAKYVLNVVEDRYIDAHVYKSAPGYRGYYTALYNRYFNLPKVSAALKSQAFRKPSLKSYKFRLTNITNPHRDLDALPGLREIYEKLDINNILRLHKPQDRFDLSLQLLEIIIKHVIEEDQKKETQKKQENAEKIGDDISQSIEEEANNEPPQEEQSLEPVNNPLDGINGQAEQSDEEEKQRELSGENFDDRGELSDQQIKEIERIIKQQEEVINGEMKQKKLDSEMVKKLNLLEKGGVDLRKVGGEMGVPKVNCVVVRNMTKELMETKEFPYTNKVYNKMMVSSDAERGVCDGIVFGTMLGRHLQLRRETHVTKFNRLNKGKFDRRVISDLGFNSENVFYQTHIDQYKKAHLHISVDASGSMSTKWQRTMTTLVAMAKAASMINNLDVTISFRSGVILDYSGVFYFTEIPYVVLAYDSRVDKFSKVVQLFPYLTYKGSTPEGLAFEAILDTIPASTPDLDSYFINISDGEPAFSDGYFGDVACNHTKKQVEHIRSNGIEVLSYFIENQNNFLQPSDDQVRIEENMNNFKVMYGKDAQLIDVSKITEIARTMNKKFLIKDK